MEIGAYKRIVRVEPASDPVPRSRPQRFVEAGAPIQPESQADVESVVAEERISKSAS